MVCPATLGTARLRVQFDVGFGDAVTPGPVSATLRCLLGLPDISLAAYPPETVVAEKLEALVRLGLINTRMKDFLDIWILARGRDFAGEVLAQAIGATFRRRRTALPESTPIALTPAFHSVAGRGTVADKMVEDSAFNVDGVRDNQGVDDVFM